MGNPDNLEQLRSMIEQDPLAQRDMHVNEKVMVWNLREECRENFSHSLAILLSCVNWNNHIEVAMVSINKPIRISPHQKYFTSSLPPV